MRNGKNFVWILDDEWNEHHLERNMYQNYGIEVKVTRSETLDVDLPLYAPFADGVVAQVGFQCGADLIEKLNSCKVISIPGVGFNHVDVDAATNKGIAVSTVPDYCAEEVSDHTLALILAVTRRLSAYNRKVRNGKWDPLDTMPIHRFSSRTVGLLGFGRIARMVAEKLKPFGVRILVHDEYVPDETMRGLGVVPVSLETLLEQSNVLSLHVPLTPETRNLMNYERLSKLPKGAFVINTCRGGVLNEEDLRQLILEGHIAGAGLDVLETEPPAKDYPLLTMEEVLITPHSSYFSEESITELRTRTTKAAIDGVLGNELPYALNLKKINI
ncbi:C-terminal binding protein [Neobacillus kokaensis]|uniref:D-isomer specific 2-hydroxyacid dehydrogenase family protein n=1 Tax=Neobacillus kokaensis TaxID=2759023 RepID=A0ABQ3N356_9BACI|nr:C-terminal binding protein [Neobacillus kokaensis]GHH99039.1 D-isomer specific 2-hydroxyacid dehydrogenase family protein [Neobacillus kokaensis]